MDTPERSTTAHQSQIGTPASSSKFEESPFSNFINSLSPINPVKTIRVSQAFGSLSFSSPPSVFTSPHINNLQESRFLRRHRAVDEGNKECKAGESDNADGEVKDSRNEQVSGEGVSGNEASVKPLSDASELTRTLKYDDGVPISRPVSSSAKESNCNPDVSASLVRFGQESSVKGSFGAELSSQEMDNENDDAACDWQSLISGGTDLFVFDSPNDGATLRGSFHKSLEETSIFSSLLSRYPAEHHNHLQQSCHVPPGCHNEGHETIDNSTQPMEVNELQQLDQSQDALAISSLEELVPSVLDEKPGNEPFNHLHRGLRRRCLDFEMPRARKSSECPQISTNTSSLQKEEEGFSENKQSNPGDGSSMCILPSIGLHLNAFAAGSKDLRVLNQEMLTPRSQEPFVQISVSNGSKNDSDPELQMVEDSSHAFTNAATEEFNSNSPKKKKRKVENSSEGENACKRCNCKKSKCLKLYCECFAAGVYCVEPCSCQDCFNKPIHEETVLATRKQIESRNPLAFAPKVIRTSDSAQEVGEDSTRTPASARHKRGCNCKKSNCLKKYCECYQGGVGCSIGCRCEGCKNAFGRKDGSTFLGAEVELEEAQACDRYLMHKGSDPPGLRDEDHHPEFTLPNTPLRHFRPSVPLPTSSRGKPPRSLATNVVPSYLNPIDGSTRSILLRSQSNIEKHSQGASVDEIPAVLQNCGSPNSNVKSLSPNSKRVSPPHHNNGQSPGFRSSRKLILQSIPSFPSLTPRR